MSESDGPAGTAIQQPAPISEVVDLIGCAPARPGILKRAELDVSNGTGSVRVWVRSDDPHVGTWKVVVELDAADLGVARYELRVQDGELAASNATIDSRPGQPAPGDDLVVDATGFSFSFDATRPLHVSEARSLRFSARLEHGSQKSQCL